MPSPVTGVLKRGRQENDVQTNRDEGHKKTEAETGLVGPQGLSAAKSRQELDGPREGALESGDRPRPCGHLHVRLLASRTVGE